MGSYRARGKRSSRTFHRYRRTGHYSACDAVATPCCSNSSHYKRDLFYTDVKLFVDQARFRRVLDDVATIIGCTRSNLHVAFGQGLVVGRIQFEEDGDYIDCTKMGVRARRFHLTLTRLKTLPAMPNSFCWSERSSLHENGGKSSTVRSLILVPFCIGGLTHAVSFFFLQEDRFYNRYPCIVMTAKANLMLPLPCSE
jgi:meiotic recombination protein SPO11